MNLKEEIKGWIGMLVNGVSFNIDLVNGCCLSCPSCAVGSIGHRQSKYMAIADFRRILDKAQNECKVRLVQMYAYSDPCMHPDLHLFVAECRRRSIPSYLSTVLQFTQCDFPKVIEARPDEFRISFAGLSRLEYYQKGAKRSTFTDQFSRVVRLPRYPETKWTLVFHRYNDNAADEEEARSFASIWDLHFVVIPSIFMPCEKVVDKNYTAPDMELISHLIETPEQNISRMKLNDYCNCWKQITLDAKADVYLCQLVYDDRFWIGGFFDKSVKDHLWCIKHAEFCRKCVKVGGNVYQECFADFLKYDDPVGTANKRRMKSV